MACHINLVQNDTGPSIIVQLTDDNTGLPIDVSTATQLIMKFRRKGATVLTDTLTGTKLPYFQRADGSYDTSSATLGLGGRVSFAWNPTTLQGAPGTFEGSVQVTYISGIVQNVYQTIDFTVRASF